MQITDENGIPQFQILNFVPTVKVHLALIERDADSIRESAIYESDDGFYTCEAARAHDDDEPGFANDQGPFPSLRDAKSALIR